MVSLEFGTACDVGEGNREAVPKIPSQTPGLVITRAACTSEATVVTTDMEKIENRRKRNARTWTPLEI